MAAKDSDKPTYIPMTQQDLDGEEDDDEINDDDRKA